MNITIMEDPNKKAIDLYYKLHKCLKISLDPKNNPMQNGDNLSCHTNNIIINLARSIESGETWYDVSIDVWCDYFIGNNKEQAAG